MKAGRELDALIAEKVMGWKRGKRYGNGNGEWTIDGHVRPWPLTWDQTPRFSVLIEAAWQVVDEMRKQGWTLEFDNQDRPTASFWPRYNRPSRIICSAETPPLAICLAAIAAVGAA